MAAQAPEASPQGPAQDAPNLPQPQPSFTPPEVFFPSPRWPHGFTPWPWAGAAVKRGWGEDTHLLLGPAALSLKVGAALPPSPGVTRCRSGCFPGGLSLEQHK